MTICLAYIGVGTAQYHPAPAYHPPPAYHPAPAYHAPAYHAPAYHAPRNNTPRYTAPRQSTPRQSHTNNPRPSNAQRNAQRDQRNADRNQRNAQRNADRNQRNAQRNQRNADRNESRLTADPLSRRTRRGTRVTSRLLALTQPPARHSAMADSMGASTERTSDVGISSVSVAPEDSGSVRPTHRPSGSMEWNSASLPD